MLVGTRCSLYDAVALPGSSGGAIDSLDLNPREAQLLRQANFLEDNLESEKFLIQVEGPWIAATSGSTASNNNNPLWNKQQMTFSSRNATNNIGARVGRKPPSQSAGMKRLMSNKFKVPSRVRPLHPEEKRRRALANSGMNKRNRPLQPGELERQYYGDGGMNGYYENNTGFQQGGSDRQESGFGNQGGNINQNGQYFNNAQHPRREQSFYDNRQTHHPDDASHSSSQGREQYKSIERQQHSDQNINGGRSDTIGRRTNPDGGTNSNDRRQMDRHVQPPMMRSQPPQGRLNNLPPSFGSRNEAGSRNVAPKQFQSNNCDPNGFYEEESDDEGCGQRTQENGQDHIGRDFDNHQQLDSTQNGCINYNQDMNRSVRFEDETDGVSTTNEQSAGQQKGQSEQSYSQEDELLALLGAAPQNETRRSDSKSGNEGPASASAASANVEGNQSDASNQRSGFMAGLLARESQIDGKTENRISLGTNLSSFSFSDRFDSGDNQSEEESGGEGPKQFGFTLPSPGESSDEESESDDG